MRIILVILFSYLLGSVSISILLTRTLYHDDVRSHGSGNAGATNVARVYGWGIGLVTFAGDFAKGLLSMLFGLWLLGSPGVTIAGMACLLGHCFPLYFQFKGGKAVSVGAAVALMIDWRLFLLILALFAAVALTTRLVSLASISAAVALSILTPLFFGSLWHTILAVFTAVLLLFMHRSNLYRLIHGQEPRFSPGHRPMRK